MSVLKVNPSGTGERVYYSSVNLASSDVATVSVACELSGPISK
jgi:hypothetical protein